MLSEDELRAALTTRLPELAPDVEAELGRVLDRASARARVRRASYAVGLVAAVVATLLVLAHDWRPPARGPDPVDEVPARAQTLVNRGTYQHPQVLPSGRYQVRFLGPVKGWPGLAVALDVPVGWGQDDVYALATGPGDANRTRRLDFFDGVKRLWPDECSSDVVPAGSGTWELARALATMVGARATGPTPTTLDGHAGYQLRLELPREKAGPRGCVRGGAWRESSLRDL